MVMNRVLAAFFDYLMQIKLFESSIYSEWYSRGPREKLAHPTFQDETKGNPRQRLLCQGQCHRKG